MIPRREKPKRLSLRPMMGLGVCVTSIAILIARGGPWRIAGYVMIAVTALAILGFRIFARRLARARQPDPQSTLKI
ncbi:MAG TPA: hypothetical protein VII81_03320 [Terriglobales bacterium]